jgi:hypothetical protein
LDSDQSSGGSYALKLADAASGGTALAPGQNQNGTNVRGGFDVYSFAGTVGQKKRLTLTQAGGDGFMPEVYAFGPGGTAIGSVYCGGSCSLDVDAGNGTYTAMVWKHDGHDVTGSYSLSVSNGN